MLYVNSCSAVYQLLQTEQAVQCTDSYMMTLGNCNGLGQFIWLIGWMVSVVKLVKWLGCWNQVVYASVPNFHCLKLIGWDEMS